MKVHCFICDKEDDKITFDIVHQEYTPCTVCQLAIQECLEDYDSKEETECDTL
jgi:hypothetical protein